MSDPQKKDGMVHATIDGIPVTVKPGTSIIEAAKQVGIEIPHYCYDPALSIVASCRLCLVQIENVPKLQPSCSTPLMDGEVVYTQSEMVLEARRMQMEFLLVQHPLDCPVCDQGGECKLQDYSMKHGFGASRFRFPKRTFPKPDIGPFIDLERNRCILCTRCVRFMDEVAGEAELAVVSRGNTSHISTFNDQPLKNEFAGNTIDLCPVGALTSKITRFRARVWELKQTPSICTLCPVGCNVQTQFRSRTHEILRFIPRENPEVNGRWICDIGRFGFDQYNSTERQTKPRQKDAQNLWTDCSWAEVLSVFAGSLRGTLAQHGPSAVAGLISPHQSNETLFLFQQFFREVLKSHNVDHRLHQAVQENEDGFLVSLGLGAANQPLRQIQQAETILILGADVPNESPILHLQLRQRIKQGARVLLAHPHGTRMDAVCDSPMRYRPGTENAVLLGLLYYLVRDVQGEIPKEVKSFANTIRILKMAELTGVDKREFQTWAQCLLESSSSTFLLGDAICFHAQGGESVRVAAELMRLLNPDAPVLPLSILRSQPNARGAADLGCYPHRGPGYEPVDVPGHNTTEILNGCVDGSIQALFVMGANLIEDYPDRQLVQKALSVLPFLVVADSFATPTAQYASLFLPLSMVTEEDGTYTNCDGRVQRATRALPQLQGTLSGTQILLALGERMGVGWKQVRSTEITTMIAAAVPAYAALDWQTLGRQGLMTGPVAAASFGGPAPLAPIKETLPDSAVDSDGCLQLRVAPSLFDLSGQKRYAQALVERSEPCTAWLHPNDASRLGVENLQKITITGDVGKIKVPARITVQTVEGYVTVVGMDGVAAVNHVASMQNPWVKIG